MSEDSANIKHHVCTETPVIALECKKAWDGLSAKEKRYAHFIGQASWAGTRIVLAQTSPESGPLFDFFQALFGLSGGPAALKEVVPDKDKFTFLMHFVACFYGNLGNYLSFGDTKFVPAISSAEFRAIVAAAPVNEAERNELLARYDGLEHDIYRLDQHVRALALPPEGISTYYSPNISKADIDLVQNWMDTRKMSAYNTRLFKRDDGTLELRIASADVLRNEFHQLDGGVTLEVTYGDHGKEMQRIADALEEGLEECANEHQEFMLQAYIESFRGGDIRDHKAAQRHWIKDVGPSVECNIGFIESYRDPAGVRGEWEGFVAVVNKDMSAKFNSLVNNAERFMRMLPWPPEFEKDQFKRPDFTSLDVLAFCSSGIPAGINIPNYDDIRQTLGFKNVSLGNVLSSRKPDERVTFVRDEDQSMYQKMSQEAFEVQVGIHELLGHGSGKLLQEESEGKFNFDKALVNPVTGKQVDCWYLPGETWGGKFGSLAGAYEECRAEACGIYLCVNRDILRIFGHEGKAATDIVYTNWLLMVRAGLMALEFYTPEGKQWRQAHMQGRFAILRVLMEAGKGLVKINQGGEDGLSIELNEGRIESVGVPAIGAFLRKLNVFKATGDFPRGREFFEGYSNVPDSMLPLRELVLSVKKPRKVFVQPHTDMNGADVQLVEFAPTAEGMVESFLRRFPVDREKFLGRGGKRAGTPMAPRTASVGGYSVGTPNTSYAGYPGTPRPTFRADLLDSPTAAPAPPRVLASDTIGSFNGAGGVGGAVEYVGYNSAGEYGTPGMYHATSMPSLPMSASALNTSASMGFGPPVHAPGRRLSMSGFATPAFNSMSWGSGGWGGWNTPVSSPWTNPTPFPPFGAPFGGMGAGFGVSTLGLPTVPSFGRRHPMDLPGPGVPMPNLSFNQWRPGGAWPSGGGGGERARGWHRRRRV